MRLKNAPFLHVVSGIALLMTAVAMAFFSPQVVQPHTPVEALLQARLPLYAALIGAGIYAAFYLWMRHKHKKSKQPFSLLVLGAAVMVGASGVTAYKTTSLMLQQRTQKQIAAAMLGAIDEQGRLRIRPGENFGPITDLITVVAEYNKQADALMTSYRAEPFLNTMRDALTAEALNSAKKRATIGQKLATAPQTIESYQQRYISLMENFGKDLEAKAKNDVDRAGGMAEINRGIEQNKKFFTTFFTLERDAVTTLLAAFQILDAKPHNMKDGQITFPNQDDEKAFGQTFARLLVIADQQSRLLQYQQNAAQRSIEALHKAQAH